MSFASIKAAIRKALPEKRGAYDGYFDDGSRVKPLSPEDTPFMKALQVVDRRDGHARLLASAWKTSACAAAIFAVAGWGAFVLQTKQSTVQVFLQEVDKYGEPGQLRELQEYTPTTDRYRFVAGDVIEKAFSVTSDHLINKDNYATLGRVLSGDALVAMSDWIKKNEGALPAARTVEIVTKRPTANPNVWSVKWRETDYKSVQDYYSNRPTYPVRTMSAEVAMEYRAAKSDVALSKCPAFCIYVTGLNFSEER